MAELRGTFLSYVDKKLSDRKLQMIGAANEIIAEYQAQGLDLTLRQLYYQFVARDLLLNSDKSYEKLGDAISDGRLVGLVPWDAITDRTRNLMGHRTFDKPVQALRCLSDGGDEETGRPADRWYYRRDLWEDQPWRPEVWIEKDALVGVVKSICDDLRVDFFACRGYNSQSAQWRAARRFARYVRKGQRPIVFHLGDHDPSGVDMTRDNAERLELLCGTPVIVQRLALSLEQVDEFKPPENPLKLKAGKLSDSRANAYVAMMKRCGQPDPFVSWELDALEPTYIRNLIADNVARIRDKEIWEESLAREVSERQRLAQAAEDFGE
jgi:hypothetical protein